MSESPSSRKAVSARSARQPFEVAAGAPHTTDFGPAAEPGNSSLAVAADVDGRCHTALRPARERRTSVGRHGARPRDLHGENAPTSRDGARADGGPRTDGIAGRAIAARQRIRGNCAEIEVEGVDPCDKCGSQMVLRRTKKGGYLLCSKLPDRKQKRAVDDELRKRLYDAGKPLAGDEEFFGEGGGDAESSEGSESSDGEE